MKIALLLTVMSFVSLRLYAQTIAECKSQLYREDDLLKTSLVCDYGDIRFQSVSYDAEAVGRVNEYQFFRKVNGQFKPIDVNEVFTDVNGELAERLKAHVQMDFNMIRSDGDAAECIEGIETPGDISLDRYEISMTVEGFSFVYYYGMMPDCSYWETCTQQIAFADIEPYIKGTSKVKVQSASPKYAALKKAIGEHKLNSVSGMMGANTMIDYYIENGKWVGSSSYLSEGMREGQDASFEQDQLAGLNSAKIVVHPDLSVTFECNGKIFFKELFNENGMTFQVSNASSTQFSELSSTAILVDNAIYLLAKDQLSEEEISFSSLANIIADAIILRMDTETGSFHLDVFQSECCDECTFSFD